jgi:transcriptional regulator with XRE-family HTH domain
MEILRAHLQEKGISQVEFAAAVGVKQPTVWEWLNGHSTPSTPRLRKISEVTGISVDDLLKELAA